MSFKLHRTNQSSDLFSSMLCNFYGDIYADSYDSFMIRFSGPVVGFTDAIISLESRVASVAETAIKAVANLIGSPFYYDCHLSDGLYQLAIDLPYKVFILAISPIDLPFWAIIETIGMLVAPEATSNYLWDYYTNN